MLFRSHVYYDLTGTLPETFSSKVGNDKLSEQYHIGATHMVLAKSSLSEKDSMNMIDEIKKVDGETVGKQGEDLSRHDKWLCMMYPRLRLLQKLLAEDGVIFINIGEDEHSNLKLICDEIFSARNYITASLHRTILLFWNLLVV